MKNKVTFKWLVEKVVEVLKYRKSIEGVMIYGGVLLLASPILGSLVRLVIPSSIGNFKIELFPSGDLSPLIFVLGSILIGVGIGISIYKVYQEGALHKRKIILALELRGLHENSATSLIAAIPKDLKGRRDELIVDIRKSVSKSEVVDPHAALERVLLLNHDLAQKIPADRQDVSIYVGGLMPVPFSFLCGVLLDDEQNVVLMDWNRDQLEWSLLDGADDNLRFIVGGLDTCLEGENEIVVAVSGSYTVDLDGIRNFKAGVPLVHLALEGRNTSCHWSEQKQKALAQQFREVLVKIADKNIKQVHLFIAAANSLVIRMGQTYDARNLPPVTVYQYVRKAEPPYQWGVVMPTQGNKAHIV